MHDRPDEQDPTLRQPGQITQGDPEPAAAAPMTQAASGATSWPWAMAQPMQTVETEPLEYHRLLRGVQKYRWWKPLLIGLLTAFFFLLFNLLIGFIIGAVVFAIVPMSEAAGLLETLVLPDTQRPVTVLVGLTSVIVTMIPAVWLAYWIMGVKPASRVLSVALKLRWSLIGRTLWMSVLAIIIMNAFGMIVAMFLPLEAEAIEPTEVDVQAALWSMLIVLLLVPIQAAAEEIIFRGAFMQVIGAWLKSPWLAILIPSVAFALAHAPTYGVWGMASVGMMGLVAAFLTWRTGGLEAAISLHVVNNLFAFAIMSTGLMGSTDQNDDGATPIGLIGQAVGFAFYVWITLRSFRKHGYGWQRIDLLQVPAPPVYANAAPAHPLQPGEDQRQ